jgi:hypothetical protein
MGQDDVGFNHPNVARAGSGGDFTFCFGHLGCEVPDALS